MPKLNNQELYDAVFAAAKDTVTGPKGTLDAVTHRLEANTALYRYSSSQYSDGTEAGARKNWTTLERDTGNRWTGTPGTGSAGYG